MALNSALPSGEQLAIILLLRSDAALVLELSKFGGALFVHAILQLAPHSAVTFTHLAKHVRLVSLAFVRFLEGAFLSGAVLAFDLVSDLLLIVVLEPLSLLLHRLL